jgi:hypothetical protein
MGLKDRAIVVFVFVLSAFTFWATPGISADSDGEPAGSDDSTGLTEVAAPIVIEAAPLLAPGPEGELPADIQDTMADHVEELKAYSNLAGNSGAGGLPGGFAGASSGIAVLYNTTYPAPTSVRTIVDSAVNQWDSVLATNPSGPIVVEVFWSNLGNPSLLGYAGPDGMFYGGGLPTSSLYPAPLANTLLGLDANGPTRPEIQVVLNAELLATNRWYLGETGTPPGSQIDLYSVVLHEVGHGLGFLGSAMVPDGGSSPALHSPPYIYDTVTDHNGTPVPDLADQAGALLSNNVHIHVSDGLDYKLYAPSNWSQGSSFSHFDESTYPAGSPGALMTPMLSSGETARVLDAPTLGLMARTGWPMTVQATTPSITTVAPSLTSAVVSWEHNLAQTGLAPDSYTVEAWRDGSSLQSSVTVSGQATTATVQSLSPGQTYTIKVVPSAVTGVGAAATALVQLETSGGPADPAQWPEYIRNKPLDGQLNRLYQAYFLRLADESGWSYWLEQRASWTPLEDISSAFASSTEFQNRYGALSDEAFVDLVYANVLNRAADADGRAYWIWALANGVSRGEVMVGFAESAEYIERTGTTAATSINEARISRLYEAFFLRTPEAEGLSYWTAQADAGVKLEVIASAFAQSAEFQGTYGELDHHQFVELVYANVLGREPDNDGMTYWVGMLEGGLDRGTAMVGFSESAEFVKSTGTIP